MRKKIWLARFIGYGFIFYGVPLFREGSFAEWRFYVGLVLNLIGVSVIEWAGHLSERKISV